MPRSEAASFSVFTLPVTWCSTFTNSGSLWVTCRASASRWSSASNPLAAASVIRASQTSRYSFSFSTTRRDRRASVATFLRHRSSVFVETPKSRQSASRSSAKAERATRVTASCSLRTPFAFRGGLAPLPRFDPEPDFDPVFSALTGCVRLDEEGRPLVEDGLALGFAVAAAPDAVAVESRDDLEARVVAGLSRHPLGVA